jgi:hypothetical protein
LRLQTRCPPQIRHPDLESIQHQWPRLFQHPKRRQPQHECRYLPHYPGQLPQMRRLLRPLTNQPRRLFQPQLQRHPPLESIYQRQLPCQYQLPLQRPNLETARHQQLPRCQRQKRYQLLDEYRFQLR